MDILLELLKDFFGLVKNELLRTLSVSFVKWTLSLIKEKANPLLDRVRGWLRKN